MRRSGSTLRLFLAALALAASQVDADGCVAAAPDDHCCSRDAGQPASAPETGHSCDGGLASCCQPLLATPTEVRANAVFPAASFRLNASAEVPPAALAADALRPPILPA